MTYGAARYNKPVKFRYHRFPKVLPPNGWSASDRPSAPRGWNWLRIGEMTQPGDLCCDPRSHPVVIEIAYPGPITANHHPILRRGAPLGASVGPTA